MADRGRGIGKLLERLVDRPSAGVPALLTSRRRPALPQVVGNPELGDRIHPKRLVAFSRTGWSDFC